MDKTLNITDLNRIWTTITTALKSDVSADTYARWFKDIELVELGPQHLTLRVPNNIHQFWIESNYISLLRAAVMLVLHEAREVRFVFAGATAKVPPPPPAESLPKTVREGDGVSAPQANGMNPRNTFENFVVGTDNQAAQGACKAVAEAPGRTYNPLFIYGGVGLGKTHLMHAIGYAIAREKKSKVVYITSEAFTNDFILAIQNGTLTKFRKRYRQADVLLIDDIQFLAEKVHTQEEFFHTFNALFDGHRQIVLSSDRPPSEIAKLEVRLVSRFQGGLTVEIQAPDIETRLAILRKKAEGMEISLPKETLDFLAERILSNVRPLEGALMRVASYVSLHSGKVPDREKIEHLLRDILHEEARRVVTIDQIQRRVAEYFDMRLTDMTSKRRPANIAFARQVAMYLARERTKFSLGEIGAAFGGRNHGTVMHAHQLVKARILADEKTKKVVLFLDNQLSR